MGLQTNSAIRQIPNTLRLSESRITSIPDLVNVLFEYFIFYRWIYFKNRPRGNLLFLRSLFASSFFFGIYLLVFGDFELVITGIELDPLIAWGAATVIGYWNMSSNYNGKTVTLTRSYQEYLSECGAGHHVKARLLASAFALQVIALDLWAHRSYGELMKRSLGEAIDYFFSSQRYAKDGVGGSDADREKSKSDLLARVSKGKLRVREARKILSIYHGHLLDEISDVGGIRSAQAS